LLSKDKTFLPNNKKIKKLNMIINLTII